MEDDVPQVGERAGRTRPIVQLAVDRQALLVKRRRAFAVALTSCYFPQGAEHFPDPSLFPQPLEQFQALLAERPCRLIVTLIQSHAPEVVERKGDTPLVLHLSKQLQALLKQRPRRRIVT